MVLFCTFATASADAAEPPWQAADEIRAELSEAQTQLLFGERDDGAVDRAEAHLGGPLRRGLAASAPAELRQVETALGPPGAPPTGSTKPGSPPRAGRSSPPCVAAPSPSPSPPPGAGDAAEARAWMQIRDFRKTTRFTRPGVDGTAALQQLAAREITPHEAVLQIEKDLLDTFQARLLTNLDEAAQAAERGFDGRFAETTAIVLGYWRAIAPEYGEQRGTAERRATDRDFERLAAAGARSDVAGFEAARERVEADLEGFTAAPLTPDEQINRASQLDRFVDLVPKEYDKGTATAR